jgi:hypothetical protein
VTIAEVVIQDAVPQFETFSADEYFCLMKNACLVGRAWNMTCHAENMVDETYV